MVEYKIYENKLWCTFRNRYIKHYQVRPKNLLLRFLDCKVYTPCKDEAKRVLEELSSN